MDEEERTSEPLNRRSSRFRSVRTKATSFSGWRESVKSACETDDLSALKRGAKLWKVRRKPVLGLASYVRKYKLDVDAMCVSYEVPSGSIMKKGKTGGSIDVADIEEVRQGLATDTFNDVEKKVKVTADFSQIHFKCLDWTAKNSEGMPSERQLLLYHSFTDDENDGGRGEQGDIGSRPRLHARPGGPDAYGRASLGSRSPEARLGRQMHRGPKRIRTLPEESIPSG